MMKFLYIVTIHTPEHYSVLLVPGSEGQQSAGAAQGGQRGEREPHRYLRPAIIIKHVKIRYRVQLSVYQNSYQ